MYSRPRNRQRGAVLIIALLVVALVSTFGVRFAADYQLGVARAENRWHGAQARSYLEGAEQLAIFLLKEDDPDVDSMMSPWAQELPPFEIEGGWLQARIKDEQSRLDLNGLYSPGQSFDPELAHVDPARFTPEQKRFVRLVQSFPEQAPVGVDEAVAILEAVVDWMDSDDEVSGFGGAESGYYQSLDPSYLPANTHFSSVEELRLVRYITPELMALLRPHLAALPPGQSQGMNINTAAPVLLGTIREADRLEPLDPMEVELVQQEWPLEGHYLSVTEFAENPGWSSIGTGNAPETQGLTINTNYFKVLTQVSLVDQRRTMESLLRREGQELVVVRRTDIY